MVIGSRQKFLAKSYDEINSKLENQLISRVDHAKSLGLIIDDRVMLTKLVIRYISSAIVALRRISALSTVVLIYYALIQPHSDYYSPSGID